MSDAVYRLADLSKWNGSVDFARVRSAGIDGVIIRTGFGVENAKQWDNRFEEYYAGAKAAGLHIGAYHYSYADSVSSAIKEAEFMLKIMKGKDFDLPVYGDFEEQGKLSKSVCTSMCKAFCDRLEAAGAWAGIYSYDSFFRDKLTEDIPKRYTVWVARVENVFPQCVSSGDIGIWQNSWKGSISGISGNVDTDYCFKDFPAMIEKAGKNKF